MRVFLLQRAEPTPHDSEGSQRVLRTGLMAEFFCDAGHDVTWFTSTFDHYNRRQRFPKSQIREVRPGYRIHYLRARAYRRNISLARLIHEKELAQAFLHEAERGERPDLIICSLPSIEMAAAAAEFAQKNRIRMVCDVRDLWPDVFLDLLPRALRNLAAPLLSGMRRKLSNAVSNSAAVTGLTDEYIDWAFRHAGRSRGILDKPLAMAYMPTDSDPGHTQNTAKMARKFDCKSGMLEVFFVGTIGPMMAIEPVIEAARKCAAQGAPVQIRVCGHGSDLSRLQGLAAGVENLSFPDWINAAEIKFLLERSHVGLLPYADLDTFRWSIPNKFGEYLAGSLALLCNLRHSAMARVIKESGAGEVYGNDAALLAQILIDLANDPIRLNSYRISAASLYRERFHGPRVFGGFVKEMEDLVANAAH